MRYISDWVAIFPSFRSAADEKKLQRSGIFAELILALHHSRGLQARRALHHHQHLVASIGPIARTPIRPAKQPIGQPSAVVEMGWLLAVAATFFLIHIVAGTTASSASANQTINSEFEAISAFYD
jgi:hypothetical protein